MIYNLSQENHKEAAIRRLENLISRKARVEIKHKRVNRTLRQNRYFHLLCGYFGINFGYTIEEVKMIIKTEVCPHLGVYIKNGRKFIISSADWNTKQMTEVIDMFKDYSATKDLPLPEANEVEFLSWVEEEISKQSIYINSKLA